MAKTDGPKDENKEPVKNLHIDVPESFHRRVKMMCVMRGKTLRAYAYEAMQEKVARDEEALRSEG
jgi:hypothetical protein